MRHKSLRYNARATYGENNWATCANSLVPKRPLILWASLFNGTLYSETVVCRIRRSSDHTQPAVRKTPECFLCCTERTTTVRQIRLEITVIIIMMCLRAEYHTVFLFVGPASSVGGSSHKRLFYCWWTTNCSNPLPPRFHSLSLSCIWSSNRRQIYMIGYAFLTPGVCVPRGTPRCVVFAQRLICYPARNYTGTLQNTHAGWPRFCIHVVFIYKSRHFLLCCHVLVVYRTSMHLICHYLVIVLLYQLIGIAAQNEVS